MGTVDFLFSFDNSFSIIPLFRFKLCLTLYYLIQNFKNIINKYGKNACRQLIVKLVNVSIVKYFTCRLFSATYLAHTLGEISATGLKFRNSKSKLTGNFHVMQKL